MKKVLQIFLVIAAPILLASFNYPEQQENDELKWMDWNTGYPKVTKDSKLGLIDVYTDWCGWCKRMDRDTYTNKDVIAKVAKNFIPIKFNPEAQGVYYVDSVAYSGPQLYAMLNQNSPSGFPTTYFIIPKGNVIYVEKVPGYQNAENFAGVLDQILAFSQKQD